MARIPPRPMASVPSHELEVPGSSAIRRRVGRAHGLVIAAAVATGCAAESAAPQRLAATPAAATHAQQAAYHEACGAPERYVPRSPYTGPAPELPSPPPLSTRPVRRGGAYTVFGASHHLRSRVHARAIQAQPISITGYVVATNYRAAPPCAVHPAGLGDPKDCDAPMPSFWLADRPDEAQERIAVMGWASSFAQIYSLVLAIDEAPTSQQAEVSLVDELFHQPLPNPVPHVGAKVRVTGRYGFTYSKTTRGVAADPRYGIMTADRIEYLEQPDGRAQLPGLTRPAP